MTMAMSSPTPAPLDMGRAAGTPKKSAVNRDPGASVGVGFEAILSSVGQDLDSSKTEDVFTKVDASADVSVQTDENAEALKGALTDPGLFLPNMGQVVPGDVANSEVDALDVMALEANAAINAVEGKCLEVGASDAGALDPNAPHVAGNALLSADKLRANNSGGVADLSKVVLADVSMGDVANVEVAKNGNFTESKTSKDQKAHQSQSILVAFDDARAKSKEIKNELIQIKSEATVHLDLLKGAMADTVMRVQEPLLAKSQGGDNFGGGLQSQVQPTVTYQSSNTLLGSMLPVDGGSGQSVNYWISADVQNAEMKLDGLGKGPVEVSISVHGKEADVTFRTDEIQTRELLESSTGSLKDLMSREGMVLTGMTVGANGSGSSNPNGKGGGKHQQGARPMIGAGVPAVQVESGLRLVGTIGKSLDLFV